MTISPDQLHPSLWRANQLAGNATPCQSSGYPGLDAELPGGGWPVGTLIELFAGQAGVGELRLLAPALANLSLQRPVALVHPPHSPNSAYCTGAHSPRRPWLWIAPERPLDALWAAEQVLKNGSCAALLFWQKDIRPASLRRLHLAAQSSDMLFFMLRPQTAMRQTSPAPLRIHLQAAPSGIELDIIKRRGPSMNHALFIDLPTPAPHITHHAPLDRRTPAPTRAGRATPVLAS